MNIRKILTAKDDGVFFCIAFLTFFFIVLEVSFFIQCNKTYLSDFSFMTSNLNIPSAILPGILHFLGSQLLIHAVFCLLIWCVTILIADLLELSKNRKTILAIFAWILGVLTILIANRYLFPNSKFSVLMNVFMSQRTAKILCFVTTLSCLFLVFIATIGLITTIARKSYFYLFILIAFVFNLALLFVTPTPPTIVNVATVEKPNIILVGVDSLRPDFLGYFGFENTTPFFDSFLDQASVFSEAVTPLARTFPAWTSILTGKYPRQVGIRFNLADQVRANLSDTLPAILQRNGYVTIYATDETRFSNIDTNYGFDEIITPPIGLNDFLVGTFNDFPLSNLLVNTPVGKWLFPYSYANRPVFYTYEPKSFLSLIKPAILEQRDKPLFLTIHFCLTHYPYLWASLPADDFSVQERYGASVHRVDKQIEDFFALLKKAHILDHAIVVMLSDHGEALELPGDRITEKELFAHDKGQKKTIPQFYPPSLDKESVNQSAGHGTDVLGLPQYHTLLAFRMYGVNPQRSGVIPGVVSLLDIKPTILQLIGLNDYIPHCNNITCEGESLADLIKGVNSKNLSQHGDIFLESDFTPEAIRTVYPETRKVVLEGVQLFQIDPSTTRLTVKEQMASMIINSKQYADIYGEWMLALYPQNKNVHMPILINLVTGEWTNDLNSAFAQRSPALHMMERLKAFYGEELNDI